jgi:SAM-dependent methyltransferase
MVDESSSYWQGASEDRSMQDEHVFVWKAMFETVDVDLTGKRVLDVGCNRGGFLRLAYDERSIASGYGYDPASAAIADARNLAGLRPLHFEVSNEVPDGWEGLDVAFSHEVLYLIHDLPAHGRTVFRALASGGAYYAVMGMHSASPIMVDWHREHREELALPPLYDLNEVVTSFRSAGFEVAASRLKVGFVPMTGSDPRMMEWLDYYNEQKILFRFTRP